jgi:hypothetical protein
MQKKVSELRSKLRLELDLARIKQKEEIIALKVSSPTRSSNLHHFTRIHHGADTRHVLSLLSHIHITIPYALQFDIIIGITCIFHLNYKNLRYAVA